MRLVRVQTGLGPRYGFVDGDEIVEIDVDDPIRALADGAERTGKERRHRLEHAQLLAPIDPGKIVAIGLNYRDHAEEQGMSIPSAPLIFAKFPSSATGPFDPVEKLPETTELDYEGELGVVIGRRGRNVRPEDAASYVAGLVVANDVSARDAQFADEQWVRGKSFDTFCPFGPWIQTLDEFDSSTGEGDVELAISTTVNGEQRQRSNTRHLIFPLTRLIAYCSTYFTLEPGDLILTGTPGGVGFSMDPPRYLAAGDVVEVEVEGLGRIRNQIVNASGPDELPAGNSPERKPS